MRQFLESVKLVWLRIPRKGLSALIIFLMGYFGTSALDSVFKNEPFSFPPNLFPAFMGSLALLALYFLVSLTFFSLKVITEQRAQKLSISPEALDRLDRRFDALSQAMQIVDDIPHHLGREELVAKITQE